VSLSNGALLTFLTGGNIISGDQRIISYNGNVSASTEVTRYIDESGFILITAWNSDSSGWNYAYGMVYKNQHPQITIAGTAPTITSGYSSGNASIQITNTKSDSYVYYSMWLFGDGAPKTT